MVAPRPLDGVHVLDFGQFVAGPFCGLLLAELGADVIRVERAVGGLDRGVQPLGDETNDGAVYRQLNRGKRSLVLDVVDHSCRPLMDSLLASTDIVIANVPPGQLEKMGLSYPRLQSINDRLILASTCAFGASGPFADQPGFDGIGQAMSGAMFLSGDQGEPRKAYAHYVDYLTGALSAYGIMAALRARESTGRGQEVQTSLLGSALMTMAANLMEESALGVNRLGTGNRSQLAAPADVFATQDGHLLLQVIGNPMFARLARMLRHPEWTADSRFSNDAGRASHGAELSEVVAHWCKTRSSAECMSQLSAAGLSAAPVLSPRQALAHPAVKLGNFWIEGSELPLAKIPLALSASEAVQATRAPSLGADTQAILDAMSSHLPNKTPWPARAPQEAIKP